MSHLADQVETLSLQLNLLQEFIELKFGLDFKEFQNFKQTHPSGEIVLVKRNNIHQIQDEEITKTETFMNEVPFVEDNFEEIINPEIPLERKRFKNTAQPATGISYAEILKFRTRPKNYNEDDDDEEQQDDGDEDDDDYHEGSSLQITNVANFTGGDVPFEYKFHPGDLNVNPQERRKIAATRKSDTIRARQEEILPRKRTSIQVQPNNYADIPTDYDDGTTYIPEKKRAKIYGYFDWDETLKKYICKRCKKSYRCPRGGGTGSLHNHLRTHADLNKQLKNDTSPQILTKMSLTGG